MPINFTPLLLLAAVMASGGATAATPYSILRNEHTYTLQADGRYATGTEMLVRIDAASALAANREQDIPFDAGLERIKVLDAYVERPDGRRRHVPARAPRIVGAGEPTDDRKFRDRRLLRIPFDGLRAGDKLYYKVVATQFRQASLIPQFFGSWTTPPPGPYGVTIDQPEDMHLTTQARGFTADAQRTTPGRIITRWRYDGGDYPRMEVGSVNRTAYRDMLAASTFDSYAALARTFDQAASRQSTAGEQLAALARAVAAGLPDQRSKALAIHRWVQQHIRYRALYFGEGAWIPSRAADAILQTGWGDCKDHVMLMEAMLTAVGVASTPALIDWGGDLYTLPEVPMMYFNHVITYVPEIDLYLDATSKDIEGGYLPMDQLDKATLLTRTGAIGHTPAHQAGRIAKRYEVRLRDEGAATFTYQIDYSGHLAEAKRTIVRNASAGASRAWLKNMLTARGLLGSIKADYGDTATRSGDFHIGYEGTIKRFLPDGGSKSIAASSALWEDINNLVAGYEGDKKRTQPFRCEENDIVESASYLLPDTLTLDSVPQDVHISNDYFDYSARYVRTGRGLDIERHLRSRQSGSLLCTPQDYITAGADIDAMWQDLQGQLALRQRQ
ncbi:DUF3857 and transglutaminase domain-containing protein [Duganella sp. BJB1802]|uniref:DUF3857 domain-containing protein n=1 Tax=Duganella sp. BJB1802 TaxID=2744575 RepID=UPI0015931EEF|nr:DUF3857 and transglutaminase domain-containing protein [Duganella sp. BJB1802]NVD71210.1 DUF3857 and transglutaminase domain-containing protein [Duganella sp. BJB1802]